MGTSQTSGWVVTAGLVVVALLAGCSADNAEKPEPVPEAGASDPAQPNRARAASVECSTLWRPGRSLPLRYNGCTAQGSTVVPTLL
ncbi:MAG: hypothetical protein K0Q93_3070, partial [Nocardioidaceae bacterium]|nr:hypothetical protein [Nocardioidaceae bacterium]